jgi:prephenate dehydratase
MSELRVAFQGASGAYSEQAVRKHFPNDVNPIGYTLSEQVIEALQNDQVDYGVLPIENSIVGNVAVNSDLLFHSGFQIIAEIYIPIKHCLMSKKGKKLEDIKKVFSHPIALAQCRDYLNKNSIIPISDHDTALACKELSLRDVENEGSIGSSLCAEYYDLEILARDIQNVENNITRFFVFVKKDFVPIDLAQEKLSLAFTTKHNPGALLDCLHLFAMHDINLTKLESRPIPQNPFEYVFFVDFIGSVKDKQVEICLDELSNVAKSIHFLGNYPISKL